MKIAAVSGPSGSGKTTLIESLIRHFREERQTVGVIKHTHHPLTAERRGDTERLLDAGAVLAILVSGTAAVIFRNEQDPERDEFVEIDELVSLCDTDILLIEGFKSVDRWPCIRLDGSGWLATREALAILDRIWRS